MIRYKDKKYMKQLLLNFPKLLPFVLSYLALTPSAALAFDANTAMDNLISLGKKGVVFVVLVMAGVFFGKKELSKCIACAVVAAIVIAISEVDKIKEFGQSILSILG